MYKIIEDFIQKYNITPCSTDDSTSTHFISGDTSIDQTQGFLYVLLNYINNFGDIDSLNIDKSIFKNTIFEDFKISEKDLKQNWNNIEITSSPSRKVGDLFWSTGVDWDKYENLNILDICCGAGGYAKKIFNWSNKKVRSYSGFDINQNNKWSSVIEWGKENSVNVSFDKVNLDECDILKIIPDKTNFFMSQSAIEHIKYDLRYFHAVKKYCDSVDFPVTQVHVFPGPASLKLYLYHGYRQYGISSIAKIAKIFPNEKIKLVRMCGDACNDLHYERITKPVSVDHSKDIRKVNPILYDQLLLNAIFLDMKQEIKIPCFWGMIIESNK